ncbi:MAG: hypothetical protein FJ211_10275, partial [Ignavibacteria bacterium]|nr:hypothetical protein [Ignavibacteria bacterium]
MKSFNVKPGVSAAGDGSPGAPGISFASGGAGIYKPGADQLAISTGGSGRLFVDASGRVSIGSSATGAPLNVTEQGVASAPLFRFIGNAANGNYMRGEWFASDNTTQLAQLSVDGTVAMYVGTKSSTPVILTTNNTERLRITSAGLVGVGVSNPVALLQTAGTVSITGGSNASSANGLHLYYDSTSSTASIEAFHAGVDNRNLQFDGKTIGLGIAGVRKVTLTSTGLGIGTQSPGATLHSAGEVLIQPITASNAKLSMRHGSIANNNFFEVDINSDTIIATNNFERCRIDSSGRLLVGTSTARATGTNASTATVQIETANNTAALQIIANPTSAFGPTLFFGKSRGDALGSIAPVENNDFLGGIVFSGADGTDLNTVGAVIAARVDGTPGANDMPSCLVFSTTADGASSPTERMRITNAGLTCI